MKFKLLNEEAKDINYYRPGYDEFKDLVHKEYEKSLSQEDFDFDGTWESAKDYLDTDPEDANLCYDSPISDYLDDAYMTNFDEVSNEYPDAELFVEPSIQAGRGIVVLFGWNKSIEWDYEDECFEIETALINTDTEEEFNNELKKFFRSKIEELKNAPENLDEDWDDMMTVKDQEKNIAKVSGDQAAVDFVLDYVKDVFDSEQDKQDIRDIITYGDSKLYFSCDTIVRDLTMDGIVEYLEKQKNKGLVESMQEYKIYICDGNGAASRGMEPDHYSVKTISAESDLDALVNAVAIKINWDEATEGPITFENIANAMVEELEIDEPEDFNPEEILNKQDVGSGELIVYGIKDPNDNLIFDLDFDHWNNRYDLEESINPLKDAAEEHKKKQKGIGAFVNPNAGDVEKGNAMFNNATDVGSAPTSGGMGESMETEITKINLRDALNSIDKNSETASILNLYDSVILTDDDKLELVGMLNNNVTEEEIYNFLLSKQDLVSDDDFEVIDIYKDKGYNDREDYLSSLADEFGLDLDTVKNLAHLYGPGEDFDGLVVALEDMVNFR